MPERPAAHKQGLTILVGDAPPGSRRPRGRGAWHVADLRRAAAPRGIEVEVTGFTTFSAHLAGPEEPWRVRGGDSFLCAGNPIIVRMMPRGSLEQVIFRMDVLHTLVAGGVRVINSPRALETSIDKYLGTVRLRGADVPVPATFACENPAAAREAFGLFGGDAVVKPLFGSEGRGVARIRSEAELNTVIQEYQAGGGVLLMQEFLPHEGCDYRVCIVAGEPLGAIERRAAASWVTNVARGGTAQAVDLPPHAMGLAVRAAAAAGAEVAGVDLLRDKDGRWWVLEVNAVPGWRAFAAATGMDVAARIIDYALHAPTRNAIATR